MISAAFDLLRPALNRTPERERGPSSGSTPLLHNTTTGDKVCLSIPQIWTPPLALILAQHTMTPEECLWRCKLWLMVQDAVDPAHWDDLFFEGDPAAYEKIDTLDDEFTDLCAVVGLDPHPIRDAVVDGRIDVKMAKRLFDAVRR